MSTTSYVPDLIGLFNYVEGVQAGNLNLSIQTGFWHDYTREGVHTGTLTLSTRSSGFLLAGLVIFIGMVGASSWSILSFILHQLRAKTGEEDGLFFQQQVILRNSGSALQAVFQILRISWAWRDQRPRRLAPRRLRRRSFFLTLPPLLIVIGFTTASIFVGDMIRSGYGNDHLKIHPANCGSFELQYFPAEGYTVGYAAVNKLNSRNMQAAKAYTRACYETDTTSPACRLYPQKSLPFVQANVPCPFGKDSKGNSLCTVDSALNLDTGLLDTNLFLGINAPPENRALLRLSSTCSPINDTEFATRRDQSISENSTIWDFNFGQGNYPTGPNYTYDTSTTRLQVPYRLRTLSDELGWTPLTPLVVSNASTTLVLLESNGMRYDRTVDDPWFSAHIEPPSSVPASSKLIYQADSYVSAMACIDQYQLCNPTTSPLNCTMLGRYEDVNRQWYDMNVNNHQLVTVSVAMDAIRISTTYWVTNGLGMAPLLAQELVNGLRSAELPDNQWQLEFQTWFKTTLAHIQAYILAIPVQPTDVGRSIKFWGFNTPDPAVRDFCSNIRIQNTGGYQSFSTLGLIIILAIGIPIIVLSLTVEPCVANLRRRRRIPPQHLHNTKVQHHETNRDKHDHREVARIADSLLQLQRQVLTSAAPELDWKARMRSVPVTIDPAARFPLPRRVVQAQSKKEEQETGEVKYDYVYRREDQVAMEEGMPLNTFLPQSVKPPPLDLNRSLPVSPIAESGPSSPSTLRSR